RVEPALLGIARDAGGVRPELPRGKPVHLVACRRAAATAGAGALQPAPSAAASARLVAGAGRPGPPGTAGADDAVRSLHAARTGRQPARDGRACHAALLAR